MKTLKKISLVQFRNYSAVSYDFPNTITCITGANGSGKTNLLDAVYYLCYTKSYFNAYQQNTVQKGMDGFRVAGDFDEETIVCKWKEGKKEVFADDVPYEKVTDHIGRYAAVMIAPDDLELLNGGSEPRRKWVDSILCQTDRDYLEKLMHYQRILQQRNAWLKQEYLKPTNNFIELDYYSQQLANDGTYIYLRRVAFLEQIIPLLKKFYRQLSAGNEELGVVYHSHLKDKPLQELLDKGLQHDLRMQRTLKGIHKDDWSFTLDGMPLKQFASQGQKKSYLFAMKLAQYAYLNAQQGSMPMLLLDDIFEKLDDNRIKALMTIIQSEGFGQVFLTDTDKNRVSNAFGNGADIGFIEL